MHPKIAKESTMKVNLDGKLKNYIFNLFHTEFSGLHLKNLK